MCKTKYFHNEEIVDIKSNWTIMYFGIYCITIHFLLVWWSSLLLIPHETCPLRGLELIVLNRFRCFLIFNTETLFWCTYNMILCRLKISHLVSNSHANDNQRLFSFLILVIHWSHTCGISAFWSLFGGITQAMLRRPREFFWAPPVNQAQGKMWARM